MERNHTSVKKLPDTPGVYFFLGSKKEVLYVGKATSLRSRVRSYFATDLVKTRGRHIVNMVKTAVTVEFRITDSVLEALILEAKLIKELKPTYNTRDKDDKSFNYLVITSSEAYPRLLTVRGKELSIKLHELNKKFKLKNSNSKLLVYGPFPHAGQFNEALKIIQKIFPYYNTNHPVDVLRKKSDRKLRFNESIGVYPPAGITEKEYAKTIRHIKLFFDGKKQQVLRSLERDMRMYSSKEEFEKATTCKRQLFALQHIEDVSLIRRDADAYTRQAEPIRIEGYDIAHLQGGDMIGVMTAVEGGEVQKSEYRTFNIRSVDKSNDTGALREVLLRRLAHPEWQYPKLFVVDGGVAQRNTAQKVLREAGIRVPVVAVTKDDKHRPVRTQGPIRVREKYAIDILLVNAEAHRFSLAVHKKKRAKRVRM